jgi:hypothetical protein
MLYTSLANDYAPLVVKHPYHQFRLRFPALDTLIAKESPPDWSAHARQSALKGLYFNDLQTPMFAQHTLTRALAPLKAWAD